MKASQSSELWLTPLIGLVGLAIFIFKHDGGHLAIHSPGRGAPLILFGVVPLLITALVQRYLRCLKWPVWGQIIAVGIIGCALVGICYFIAAPYCDLFSLHDPNNAEGYGDTVTLIQFEAPILGLVGGLAATISTILLSNLRPKD